MKGDLSPTRSWRSGPAGAPSTFKDEGVFNYNCALHPNMKGTVQVSK